MPDSCPARFTECQKVALMIGTAKGERRYRYYVRAAWSGFANKVRKGGGCRVQKSSGSWL